MAMRIQRHGSRSVETDPRWYTALKAEAAQTTATGWKILAGKLQSASRLHCSLDGANQHTRSARFSGIESASASVN
jgi:hypothetical protein